MPHFHTTLVVTHTTPIFGPPQALANYLSKQSDHFIYISHPLTYDARRCSTMEVWHKGVKVREQTFPNWSSLAPLNYLKDLWATCWLIGQARITGSIDYYIGCDSLSALPVVWLRSLWRIKHFVTYNVDYSTKRFGSTLLNTIYRWADRVTTKSADTVWCVTARIAEVRRAEGKKSEAVLVVPNGVYPDQIKTNGGHRKGLVFTGHLVPEKGVDQLLKVFALTEAINLTIYGSGPELNNLKRLVKQLKLESRVYFGGQKTNQEILALLSEYSIGLALYDKSESYVAFSDPLKVKEYLAAGLPVVMTDVPEVAMLVKHEKVGVVISDLTEFPQAIQQAVSEIPAMQQRTVALAERFDWSVIYTKAFNEMQR